MSLFPEFFTSPLSCALMQKGREAGLVDFSLFNPRDAAKDKHKTVDDRPYGGGPGMVMMLDPLVKTLRAMPQPGRILLMSPKGRPFTQNLAHELSREHALTLICGRYEGIDARLESLFPLEEISVGDMILNGGETAALAIIESVSRLLPGFMGHEESGTDESFSDGLLEYPHFTRPEEYEGLAVPEILRSGDHGQIKRWRRDKALDATVRMRPELLEKARLSEQDMEYLRTRQRRAAGRNLFLTLVHYPVLSAQKKSLAVSLTNLDIHDIARSSCTYGLGAFYVATPLEDQQKLLSVLLEHWVNGPGSIANPDRAKALSLVRGVAHVQDAVDDIARKTGQRPRIIATSARGAGSMGFTELRELLAEEPALLLLGTSHGLAPQILAQCDGMLPPIRACGPYNHLSVRAAAAITLDRILGDWY